MACVTTASDKHSFAAQTGHSSPDSMCSPRQCMPWPVGRRCTILISPGTSRARPPSGGASTHFKRKLSHTRLSDAAQAVPGSQSFERPGILHTTDSTSCWQISPDGGHRPRSPPSGGASTHTTPTKRKGAEGQDAAETTPTKIRRGGRLVRYLVPTTSCCELLGLVCICQA